eukprot:350740-Chlamydomonas_euryale.AAC.3
MPAIRPVSSPLADGCAGPGVASTPCGRGASEAALTLARGAVVVPAPPAPPASRALPSPSDDCPRGGSASCTGGGGGAEMSELRRSRQHSVTLEGVTCGGGAVSRRCERGTNVMEAWAARGGRHSHAAMTKTFYASM